MATLPVHTYDVPSAYVQLIDVLQENRGARRGHWNSRKIIVAGRTLEEAISHDGGVRDALATDAHNIVSSLKDGTFSAEGSIDALRRDAKGDTLDVGAWTPASLEGTPIARPIGGDLRQAGEGDCVGVSTLKAFSNTRVGAEILALAVKTNPDGGYSVNLPGEPTKTYRFAKNDLDQYGTGDPPASAVIGAMYAHFKLDAKKDALPTNKAMALLAGHYGRHERLADAQTTAEGIETFLGAHAKGVGTDVAMVFGGAPDKAGDWSRGDGHAFAILRIDVQSGMVTYTNPWNDLQEKTMKIADLARQAAHTPADFEIVTFSAPPLDATPTELSAR